jgi:hypothetical protein
MEDALQKRIRQGEVWVPESLQNNLTATPLRTRRVFQTCFKGNWKFFSKFSRQNFHEYFGTNDFPGMMDSFQIKVPIRNDRVKIL